MIDISQWLIGLGVTGFEEPTANNQYEFFKGVQWTDGSVTNNQYEFFKKVGESRYEHFKQFGNERQFYKDIAVPVIKDYYTFYKYARDYITFYEYLLDNYGGAAAAYSLRSLNSTYTGDCIEVRRDSDNATLDIGFVNNELDTTTLSTFCNTPVNVYTSDFSVSEDLSEFNGIGSAANTIDGVSDAYKFTLTGGNGFHISSKLNYFTTNVGTTVTFDYYIPSTNTTVNSIRLAFLSQTYFFNVTDSWETVNITGVPVGDDLQIFAANGTNFTVNADGDVFYLKNIVVTQQSSNGYVTKWFDQSGNQNDAVQTTASAQPKIYDSVNGIIEVNGKTAIYTDGVDDFIESTLLSLSNPTTQFFVFKTLGTGPGDTIGGLRLSATAAPSLIGADTNNLYLYQQGPQFSPKIPHNQNQVLITAKSSTIGTDWAAFYNSNIVTNGGEDIGLHTGSLIRFGSQSALVGFGENYLQEYILYDSDETGNRVGIETNINQRYNIYQ